MSSIMKVDLDLSAVESAEERDRIYNVTKTNISIAAHTLSEVCAHVDSVYGADYSRKNPELVHKLTTTILQSNLISL